MTHWSLQGIIITDKHSQNNNRKKEQDIRRMRDWKKQTSQKSLFPYTFLLLHLSISAVLLLQLLLLVLDFLAQIVKFNTLTHALSPHLKGTQTHMYWTHITWESICINVPSILRSNILQFNSHQTSSAHYAEAPRTVQKLECEWSY